MCASSRVLHHCMCVSRVFSCCVLFAPSGVGTLSSINRRAYFLSLTPWIALIMFPPLLTPLPTFLPRVPHIHTSTSTRCAISAAAEPCPARAAQTCPTSSRDCTESSTKFARASQRRTGSGAGRGRPARSCVAKIAHRGCTRSIATHSRRWSCMGGEIRWCRSATGRRLWRQCPGRGLWCTMIWYVRGVRWGVRWFVWGGLRGVGEWAGMGEGGDI